jgi:hypothetical protein
MRQRVDISRRLFVTLTAGAMVVPPALFAANEVPALLDHILLGSNDLQRGIDFVEEHTGVLAVFGGVHPGRGTQNALLSLGERRYLEIIAPDPAQPGAKNFLAPHLHSLQQPRLVGWAAHPGNLSALADRLRAAHIEFQGPTSGSRKRPDGRLLQWQTLGLADDASGLLPFFIEWAPDAPHPSADAPQGCSLVKFGAESPDPAKLAVTLKLLTLDLPIEKGSAPRLLCTVKGPKGLLEITS